MPNLKTTPLERSALRRYLNAKPGDASFNSRDTLRLLDDLETLVAAVDCGQDGVCASAPGCARHWGERNRELVAEVARLKLAAAPAPTCRECSECSGHHHWIEVCRLDLVAYGCKHCEVTVGACDDCDGPDVPGHECEEV